MSYFLSQHSQGQGSFALSFTYRDIHLLFPQFHFSLLLYLHALCECLEQLHLLLQLEEQVLFKDGFILCSFIISFLLSPPPHHRSGFISPPPIPSTLFSLTYFILDTSPFIIFCPRCDFAFPLPFLTSLRGFSCSSLPPPNIPPTAHHFCTFPNEKEG